MSSFELLPQQLFNGLLTGALYCLMGIGLSLIMSIMDIINFAQTEFLTLGAYIGFFLLTFLGFDYIVAILLSMAVIFFLGLVVERLIILPLKGRPQWIVNTVTITLGLAVFFQNFLLLVFGGKPQRMSAYFSGTLTIFGFTIILQRLFLLIMSIFLVAGLWFFINYSRPGLAIKAVAQDAESALVLGINIKKMYMLTFGISVALAAAAGMLLAPIYAIYPRMGWDMGLKMWAAVILGGLGTIRGVIYAAFILGIVESLIIFFIGSAWKEFIVFLIILIILLLRPTGVFGVAGK